MTKNMEQCEVRPTDLKVVIDSVSLDYWSITVQKVSQRCKRYILDVISRLPPAEPATADPGTDCATARPHVTSTLSVSPGDFVWNF